MLRRLRDALSPTTGGLPEPFWWLLLGMLVTRLGTFVVPYLAIYLTTARGATAAQAGTIASLWGVGAIASGPVGGTLADRLGRRATMLGALAAAGAWTVAVGFVEGLGAIGAAVLALGFLSGALPPGDAGGGGGRRPRPRVAGARLRPRVLGREPGVRDRPP